MKTPPDDLATRLLAISADLLRPDAPPRFEEVAQKVGVSRAALYYYFSGRDDLLGFVLMAHVEEGAAAMAAADPGGEAVRERLRAVVAAAIAHLGERPGVCAGLLAAASSTGTMRDVLELNDARIAAPLRELIGAGVDGGELDAPDAGDAANAILGAAMMGVLGHAGRGEDPTAPDFQRGLVEQIVRGVARP